MSTSDIHTALLEKDQVMNLQPLILEAFRQAAGDVPAYAQILREASIESGEINSLEDFKRLPIIDKASTFEKFALADLCRQGTYFMPAGIITSSGHSGRFAYGIIPVDSFTQQSQRIDDALELFFQARTKTTLLINCLPMGVQIPATCCTVAPISVREDMAVALVQGLASYYEQIILVGETAFIKRVLEYGREKGINWSDLFVHVIVGEEPIAENARAYLQSLLGIDPFGPETGLVVSSMGVAEIGLNLFMEIPQLAMLRRVLHQHPQLQALLLGSDAPGLPMLFTYDPTSIYIEILDNREMIITTLDSERPLPLMRYRTGDIAQWVDIQDLPDIPGLNELKQHLPAELPVIAIFGRGQFVTANGCDRIYPEQIKEGLYHDHTLAAQVTGNFRIYNGAPRARCRIQLAPGVKPDASLNQRFTATINTYVSAPVDVACEAYESFIDGMTVDYERKFAYIE
ncbi:MAG: hypothetical protein JW709_03420 [Sedimentisphaerales bacterium]|nr:hypothetical protein [Sedimentisphaerales bacterium]